MTQRGYDFFGNVALAKFPRGTKKKDKTEFAKRILKEQPAIKTILEKSGDFKGRLRKLTTKILAGEKTKEVVYKENGCTFRFNIDKTYFSPRLSNERKEIAQEIKPTDKVLVMFAGIAPFSIVVAKLSKAFVVSNEINREANKYAEQNIQINKLKNIELANGDIKKVAKKIKEKYGLFDVILMPRPQLKDSFLKQALLLSKKGTKIYYYDFCMQDETEKIVERIKKEASAEDRKITVKKVKPAGDLSPRKIRLRVDFVVEN